MNDKKDWSKHDERVNELTGFVPADRSKRECTSCNGKGHYYYECNDGAFLDMAEGLAIGLKAIEPK